MCEQSYQAGHRKVTAAGHHNTHTQYRVGKLTITISIFGHLLYSLIGRSLIVEYFVQPIAKHLSCWQPATLRHGLNRFEST